jgi:hypothetical protein
MALALKQTLVTVVFAVSPQLEKCIPGNLVYRARGFKSGIVAAR